MTSEHNGDSHSPEDESKKVRQRLLLPFLIPAMAFLFAMLGIYGLSRIYLDLKDFKAGDVNAATPLALGVALAILGVSWYLASNPKAGRFQIGAIAGVAVAMLIGGSIWSAVYEGEAAGGEPTPPTTTATAVPPGTVNVSLTEYKVTVDPASVPAGEITFHVTDAGTIFHNLRVVKTDLDPGALPANGEVDESRVDVVAATDADLEAGQTVDLKVDLQPGNYVLLCNVPGHYASNMHTAFTVEEAPPGGTTEPPPGGEQPPPGGGPPGGAATEVDMQDNVFVSNSQQEPAIPASAGQETTLNLVNHGLAVHNMHIAGPSNEFGADFCEAGGDEPCSDPPQLLAGESASITFQFDQPGTYDFRCDFHPTEMFGTIVVQ
ncbi:MAG: plastocyanin/azurin family copper-binding protein [Dehalococcoidia bacterium]